MKLRVSNRKMDGLTLIEVLVAIGIIVLLAAIFLPALAATKKKSSKIGCVNNLKQIGLFFRIWSGDNGDKYPMEVSVANGGAMESVVTGDVVSVFQVMSNELSTPKILICPNDEDHAYATNFNSDFTARNISYFAALAAYTNSPQAFLSGDDHFQVGRVPVKSGLLEISPATPVKWAAERHKFAGNIGLVDGSVQPVNNSGLAKLIRQTGLATNRLAIP
ncbi:MAG: type II secretion system protein [Verrucomicrobiales bacterium]|nr:type II secretion system protein [Verrucomicrobiales bacterium]